MMMNETNPHIRKVFPESVPFLARWSRRNSCYSNFCSQFIFLLRNQYRQTLRTGLTVLTRIKKACLTINSRLRSTAGEFKDVPNRKKICVRRKYCPEFLSYLGIPQTQLTKVPKFRVGAELAKVQAHWYPKIAIGVHMNRTMKHNESLFLFLIFLHFHTTKTCVLQNI